MISAQGLYVWVVQRYSIVTQTNVEKEVRTTYSGPFATRNRIETFNWAAATATAWRIHFCGFGSVHSSKPSFARRHKAEGFNYESSDLGIQRADSGIRVVMNSRISGIVRYTRVDITD